MFHAHEYEQRWIPFRGKEVWANQAAVGGKPTGRLWTRTYNEKLLGLRSSLSYLSIVACHDAARKQVRIGAGDLFDKHLLDSLGSASVCQMAAVYYRGLRFVVLSWMFLGIIRDIWKAWNVFKMKMRYVWWVSFWLFPGRSLWRIWVPNKWILHRYIGVPNSSDSFMVNGSINYYCSEKRLFVRNSVNKSGY